MKQRSTWLLGSAIVFALVACDANKSSDTAKDESSKDEDDDGEKKKKKKDEEKSDEDEKAAAKDDAPKDEEAAAKDEPTVVCGAATQIPEIPSERSNPPTLEEWGSACDINTQGAGSQAGDCTMKIKREWLQVTCRGGVKSYENFEGFGDEGLDYFKQVVPGEMTSFVVRLRKGKSQKVRMCRDDERASLFVSWPPSAPKPTIVALGVGPKCDGSK